MKNLRFGLIVICILLWSAAPAPAQVSIGIGLPNVRIGINLPFYPELAPVPGYPVYYAPRIEANYFFYDGMFWVFWDGNWYASTWYNGPWALVYPDDVPLFILRIPVRYYLRPPLFFRGWQLNAPPHWGKHWGHAWEQRRKGWDRWNRGSAPARAPLPVYQRHYSGDSYPRLERQRTIRSRQYNYRPNNTIIRRHFEGQRAPAQPGKRAAPPTRSPEQQKIQRSAPHRQAVPETRGQERQPKVEQRNRQEQRYQEREQRFRTPERGQGQEREKTEERGRGHNK